MIRRVVSLPEGVLPQAILLEDIMDVPVAMVVGAVQEQDTQPAVVRSIPLVPVQVDMEESSSNGNRPNQGINHALRNFRK